MDDLSNVLAMVFEAGYDYTISDLLTPQNIKELEYLRHLLILKTSPDYIEGSDERTDAILETEQLTSQFLGGLQCGILMGLALDPFLIPSPHHIILKDIWDKARALKLEQDAEIDL